MLNDSNQLFILSLLASGVSAVPAFVAAWQLQLGLQSAPQKLCSMCLNKAPWQENRQELGSQPCCLSQLLQKLLPSGQDSFQPPAPWEGPQAAPNL